MIYVYSFCRSSCDLDFPDKILQGALGAKLFCDNSRPLRDDYFTINLTLGEKFIIGIFYTICRANSNKPSSSLVSTSSLSIYDKTRGEKALTSRQNRFFRASKQSFAIYFPLATLQYLPRGDPMNLCANARIHFCEAIVSYNKVFCVVGYSAVPPFHHSGK